MGASPWFTYKRRIHDEKNHPQADGLCALRHFGGGYAAASAQELFTPEGVLLTVQIAVTLPNGTLSFLRLRP